MVTYGAEVLEVLEGRGDDITGPLIVAALAVMATWIGSRPRSGRTAAVIGGAALLFLIEVRGGLSAVIDALREGPWWFVATALGAGVVTAAALARLLGQGRAPEGLFILGVGLTTAAAALPDVEILLGAAALWGPWLLARSGSAGDGASGSAPGVRRGPVDELAATLVALVAVVALVDGSRGRPSSLLIVPIVVGPVALLTAVPGPLSWPARVAAGTATAVVGITVARGTGLDDGRAAPLLASVVGLAGLAGLAVAVRRLRGRPG